MNTIERELSEHTERVFKTMYQNQSCYVKRRIESKRNTHHRALQILFWLTRNPMFAVTVPDKHTNVCITEAQKLNRLHQAGINVPQVFDYTDDYLVIEDSGLSLIQTILNDPDNTQQYLQMAIKTLAKLHHAGECHGGSQIRNFTYKDGKVYLIDFEEIIEGKAYQGIILRDIILFLMSIVAQNIIDCSIPDLISVYEQNSGIKVSNRLYKFANRLRFLKIFTKKPFNRLVGKDVVMMNNFLETMRLKKPISK